MADYLENTLYSFRNSVLLDTYISFNGNCFSNTSVSFRDMFIHYRQLQFTLLLRFEQLLTYLSNYVELMTQTINSELVVCICSLESGGEISMKNFFS